MILCTSSWPPCTAFQALSNSIWALAHIRMTVADMDAAAGPNGQGLTHRFMLGIAVCALAALSTLRTPADTLHMQAAMLEAERRFSAQVQPRAQHQGRLCALVACYGVCYAWWQVADC